MEIDSIVQIRQSEGSTPTPGQKKAITIVNNRDRIHEISIHETEATHIIRQPSPDRSTLIKFVEIKRFIFQLENILEFTSDPDSDNKTLITLLE